MKFLQRSLSTYQKPQMVVSLATRQVSMPVNLCHLELWDEPDANCRLPIYVIQCLIDAKASFSNVCATLTHTPEAAGPDYTPEHLDAVLVDAEFLLPVISHLVTDDQPNELPLVRDILTHMQTENPNLETQSLARAIHAVKHAILLLHLDDKDSIAVDTLISQPREMIAAAMIVNKYLDNLTH